MYDNLVCTFLAYFDGFKSCYPEPLIIPAQISPTFIASPDLVLPFHTDHRRSRSRPRRRPRLEARKCGLSLRG
jgi:hypothetical protein